MGDFATYQTAKLHPLESTWDLHPSSHMVSMVFSWEGMRAG